MGRPTRKPGAAAAATVAAPADQTPAPADAPADAAPADQTPAPADAAPADQTPAPADAAPADQTPAPADAPASQTPAPAAPNLVAIMALADGMVTADSIHQAALDAYRSSDAKGRAAIRRSVDDASKQAIRDTMGGKLSPVDGMALAGHWQRTLDALSATPAKPAATVDYVALVADRIAALRHAADMLAEGVTADSSYAPDGIPSDVSITSDDIMARLDAIENGWSTDEMKPIRLAALAYANAKIGRSGKQNDVGAAITAAFQGVPVGTELTVSQIIAGAAAAGIDCDGTWNGRITARLIGGEKGCTVPGVAHARIGADRTHGGRKVS